MVTPNCYILERSTGTTVYHSCAPCAAAAGCSRAVDTGVILDTRVHSLWTRVVFTKQGWARDVNGRDRDETETLAFRDRDETETFGLNSRDETETRRLQVSRRYRDVEVHVYCH